MTRSERERVSGLIERLRKTEISNYEFEEGLEGIRWAQDPALTAILGMVWCLYSDQFEHKLEGVHAPDAGTLPMLCRCEAFLQTALPYEWSYTDFAPPPGYLSWLVEAALGHTSEGAEVPRDTQGDATLWPFYRVTDWHAVRE